MPSLPIVTPVPESIDKDSTIFHQRLCRFTRQVAGVLNALGFNGSIQLTGLNQWQTGAGLFLLQKIAQVEWGTPGALTGDTITVPASLKNAELAPLDAVCDLEIVVSDGLTDASPSHTATLQSVLGTTLDGTGTATLRMRTVDATPAFSVEVTETTSGVLRYLWIGQSRNSELLITTLGPPILLTFFTNGLWADDGSTPLLADDNITILTAG
jgi:hypothetical protein